MSPLLIISPLLLLLAVLAWPGEIWAGISWLVAYHPELDLTSSWSWKTWMEVALFGLFLFMLFIAAALAEGLASHGRDLARLDRRLSDIEMDDDDPDPAA
jgi:hypothetical protein